ncbi:hypothetical protein AGMMS49921_01320 [Endomicrobiia bacterium]|nr:hypothetical protein AGMMS49921_01320 [Endomicrobiia bacterium]
MFVLSGIAFSSEINVRGSFDCFGEIKIKGTRTLTVSQKKEMLTPISTTTKRVGALAVEWLFPLNNSFKLGAGLEYGFPREFDDREGRNLQNFHISLFISRRR